jgi:hypothetical protein
MSSTQPTSNPADEEKAGRRSMRCWCLSMSSMPRADDSKTERSLLRSNLWLTEEDEVEGPPGRRRGALTHSDHGRTRRLSCWITQGPELDEDEGSSAVPVAHVRCARAAVPLTRWE